MYSMFNSRQLYIVST